MNSSLYKRVFLPLLAFGVASNGLASKSPPVVFESSGSGPGGKNEQVRYQCDAETWVSRPEVIDGIYIAHLEMKCRVAASAASTVAGIRKSMEETLLKTRVVHEGPTSMVHGGLPSSRYLVTVALKDEGEGIQVQEEVWIGSNEDDRLLYETDSRSIQAQGMAAYLRKVWFRSDVERSKDQTAFVVKLSNRIEIARPWYAMEWVFTPIAQKSVIRKFHKVRDEILPKIAGHLVREEKGTR